MEMDDEKLETLRHSTSHLMAAAVLKLYPKAKLGIGPPITDGFYYDFDLPEKIAESDLSKIEKIMAQLSKQKLPFERQELTIAEAKRWAHLKNQPYKLELIEELEKEGRKKVSFYKTGEFFDLCSGPHIADTSQIRYFKLLSIAGAYWKGSEQNPMLTRIYGTVWPKKEDLEKHIFQLEERKRRDHRKIGLELELFVFHDTAPGMPYWLPKGLTILNELIHFWRDYHKKNGYLEIATPLISEKRLWEISGHWQFYKDEMFKIPMDDNMTYALKPMNCPNTMIIFATKVRSYKDLPLRLSDTDILHRFEKSGTLSGLFRTRKFQQDDAHIFIREEQIEEEYTRILKIADYFYSIFGLKYRLRLGTRPQEYLGDKNTWDKAEDALKRILKNCGKEYFILEGDGAFYGPKIDILMTDILGREWQMGTIQLDFQLPKRFKLKYTESDGTLKTPVVIHRVIYGSLERFIGILIEHYGGAFPLWLSPIQTIVIPIAERHSQYAQSLKEKLIDSEIRTECDLRSETMQAKIRDAQLQKIPYMIIVGDKEEKTETVAIRTREGNEKQGLKIDNFIKKIKEDIAKKELNLIL